jgi:integrase
MYPAKAVDQVRAVIQLRHNSSRTERAYVGWIRRFILFNSKRHPLEMGEVEISRFLSSLAIQSRASASTQNQALNALLFLYREVPHQDFPWLKHVVRAERTRRLPVVLTRQQVRSVLDQLSGTPRLMAVLLYCTGLRLLECTHLRIKDLDFGANQIILRDGKGQKDQVALLPEEIRPELKNHLDRGGPTAALQGSWARWWMGWIAIQSGNPTLEEYGCGSRYFPGLMFIRGPESCGRYADQPILTGFLGYS